MFFVSPFHFSDPLASTPAVVSQNDVADDDDDEDLDDVDQGEELNTPQHLVLAQFDKVKMHSSIFV